MMNRIKWAYVAGEVWAFIQVHNLMPIIVAFAVGWYVSYIQTANLKQFKMQMSNQQYTFQMEVVKELDSKFGTVKGESTRIATDSAVMKKVTPVTPTPAPTLLPIIKKLLVRPSVSVDQSSQ